MGVPAGKDCAHPDLFEKIDAAVPESKMHFARSMRTFAVKYEEDQTENRVD